MATEARVKMEPYGLIWNGADDEILNYETPDTTTGGTENDLSPDLNSNCRALENHLPEKF